MRVGTWVGMCFAGLLAAACAPQAPNPVAQRTQQFLEQPATQTTQEQAQPRTPPQRTPRAQPARTFSTVGTDAFLAPKNQRRAGSSALASVTPTGAISLNLVGASVEEAAKAVIGDALGLNYVIRDGLSGAITLQTTTPLDQSSLLEAFQTALELNGATLSEAGDLISIVPLSEATPRFIALGDERGLGRRIVVVPLQFISSQEMARLLEPIVSPSIILRVSERRNLLMVTGGKAEIDAVLEAVNLFDVDVLSGKSVALVRLQAANPKAVAEELSFIFETDEGGSLEGVLSFVPNERLGSVLVISSRARYIREAREFIQQLDATAGQSRRYSEVYLLQNRTAEDVQPVLAELLQAAEADPTANDQDLLLIDDGAPQVVGDPIRNAIIVLGTLREQEEIAQLINKLDATPTQVLLEATIAEVTLNDELEFGVRWFFETGGFRGRFSDLASGGTGPSSPGFSFLFDAAGVGLTLNALSAVTDVKVVSSPSILVLDNREAELRVGDQVPVATESAVNTQTNDAPIVNTISFRDTGIILKVRPRVSESGRVIMDIEQEVSDVVPTTTSGIDSPTISQRIIRTSIAVDSGETLALGGLIQDRQSNVKTRVPLLGDIPVIGAAFGSTDDVEQRSELLILVTPRVIRNTSEARRITEEFRDRLRAPDSLLSGGARGKRHQLQRIFN